MKTSSNRRHFLKSSAGFMAAAGLTDAQESQTIPVRGGPPSSADPTSAPGTPARP